MNPTEITIKIAPAAEGSEISNELISVGEGVAPPPTLLEEFDMTAGEGEAPAPASLEELDMDAEGGEAPAPTSLEELDMTAEEDEALTPIPLEELDMEAGGMNLEEIPEPDLTEELEESVGKKKTSKTRSSKS